MSVEFPGRYDVFRTAGHPLHDAVQGFPPLISFSDWLVLFSKSEKRWALQLLSGSVRSICLPTYLPTYRFNSSLTPLARRFRGSFIVFRPCNLKKGSNRRSGLFDFLREKKKFQYTMKCTMYVCTK